MKLNYKLKVCLMSFAFLFIGSTVMATNNFKTEIIVNNSDEWVEIKNENGIKISVQRIIENGELYLNIKFDNLTNKQTQFNWTLINGKGKVLTQDETTLTESNKTTKLVPIKNGEISGYDCSISITLNN